MVEKLVLDAVTSSSHSTLCFDGYTDITAQSLWATPRRFPWMSSSKALVRACSISLCTCSNQEHDKVASVVKLKAH